MLRLFKTTQLLSPEDELVMKSITEITTMVMRLEQSTKNGSVDEIHACKAIKKITWLHKQIRQRIPYKLMKMNLKKWTVSLIQDLEPIVKKHQERIRLSNKLKVLK